MARQRYCGTDDQMTVLKGLPVGVRRHENGLPWIQRSESDSLSRSVPDGELGRVMAASDCLLWEQGRFDWNLMNQMG